ncbi:ATP-binding protein [Lichenihabitans psoromatis]|uniref:ATP-binding protein n=1 Tax=Lichenihabitans psoromatis TaxID=2528642 RepID=UPI001035B633|nr:ATP-binding protein [Lichenihabitans psoromatis]
MSSETVEPSLSGDDVKRVVAGHSRAGDDVPAGALWILAGLPLRVVWANRAAIDLVGRDDPDAALDYLGGPDGEAIRRRLIALPVDHSRSLERLRIGSGSRSRNATLAFTRHLLASGEVAYGVLLPGAPDRRHGADNALSLPALPESSAAPLPVPEDAPSTAEQGEPRALAQERAAPDLAEPQVEPLDMPDALQARLAAQPSSRFRWQTDREGRVVDMSGGLADLFGMNVATSLVGQSLAKSLEALGCDPDRKLATAFTSNATWKGLTLPWPIVESKLAVQATLGAVPLVDQAGDPNGFRGFGVADLTAVSRAPSPDTASLDSAATTPLSNRDAGLSVPPDDEPSSDSVPAATGDEGSITPAALASPDNKAGPNLPDPQELSAEPHQNSSYSSKVVALRPNQWLQQASGAPAPVRDLLGSEMAPWSGPPKPLDPVDAWTEDARSDLSSLERSAFQEIARALGGKVDDEPVLPDTIAPVVSERQTLLDGLPREALDVIEQLPAAILLMDADRPIYVNQTFRTLTSYASPEALAEVGGLRHLLGGLDLQHVEAGAQDRAFPITDAAGQIVAVEGRVQPIALGDRPLLMASFRLATDRIFKLQTLEFELRRRDAEAAEASQILDLVSDVVVVLDLEGRLRKMNAAAERLFDCVANEVAGQSITRLLEPESHAASLEVIANRSSGDADGPASIEVVGRTRGAPSSVNMSAKSIGSTTICVLFHSATVATAATQDLAAAQRDLDLEKASKSDFLAKVSHEVRTPLNAILGFTEVMLDERFGPIGNPRYTDYLRDIHEAGAHVMHLVSDLLDLSKVEAGRLEMSMAAVDANRVVGECVSQMQATAHRERVIMRLSLASRLPAALVDEQALRQVVTNILSNAVKFNEPGGQVIVSTAVNDAGDVAVRVRDTGVGMSDDEIGMAMEPFRQMATSTVRGGSGLGLPLTRALVEANHASLTIKSRKHEGTLVEIVLKALPAEPMRMPAE